jgi:hypothetical protein
MSDSLGRRLLSRLTDASLAAEISRKLLWAEQYAAEVVLTTASIWACYVLLTPPSNFEKFPESFALAETLQGHEVAWGIIAAIGATLKMAGLFVCALRSTQGKAPGGISYTLRCSGLFISGVFWGLMGISSLWGNPDSLFGLWGILAAVTAWWILIRFPIVPGEK